MKIVFEWDARKAQKNLAKHKVGFDEAKSLFNDPLLLTYADDKHSEVEERYISIGVSNQNRTLLVIHTDRKETSDTLTIRIVSCRKATASEQRKYEEDDE